MGNDPALTPPMVLKDPTLKVDGILRRINGHREPPKQWLDATALIAEPAPEHDWVVPDLIERQGRILLVGAEKSGKSLLALTLAVQVASNIPALDWFPSGRTAGRKVLYMDLEMGRSSTRRRLRSLSVSAKGKLEPGALDLYLRPDGLDMAADADILLRYVGHSQPDLVIIDPLYKMTLTDSNYERDIKPTLKFLDELRLAFSCGIILVHHLRKRGQGEATRGKDTSDVFGSSVLLRWPETILMLNEDRLRVAADRDDLFGDLKSFTVRRGGTWPIALTSQTDGITEEVYDLVRAVGPISGASVARELRKRRKDIYEAINSLKMAGRISHDSVGRWEST